VRVYCDTGIFVDYLSARSPVSASLRTSPRRGRSPADLARDAEKLLQTCLAKHVTGTSTLTFYEVEESVFKDLSRTMKGVPLAHSLLIPVARSAALQFDMATRLFGVQVLELTQPRAQYAMSNHALNMHAIRAADALHISTAVEFEAEILVTGDDHVIALGVCRE
jgi:predicted nucleic acid-binding protein